MPVGVHFHFDEGGGIAGGLNQMGAVPVGADQRDMLVAGQQQIKGDFVTQAAGDVFIRVGEKPAGGRIPLDPAVIDADQDITVQGGDGFFRALQRGSHVKSLQVFRLFPAIDPVGDDADQADAQPVAEPVNRAGENRQLAPQVVHIRTETFGVQFLQIIPQVFPPVVKIVVAQCDIVIAPGVHGPGNGQGNMLGTAEIGQGRPLEHIAAVDDQRVFVFRKAHGKKPHVLGLRRLKMRGVQVSVDIRGEVYSQKRCHISLLSVCSGSGWTAIR